MRTQNKNKKKIPVDHPSDGDQLNLSDEENRAEDTTDKEDDTPELDEDIMMYMIHI